MYRGTIVLRVSVPNMLPGSFCSDSLEMVQMASAQRKFVWRLVAWGVLCGSVVSRRYDIRHLLCPVGYGPPRNSGHQQKCKNCEYWKLSTWRIILISLYHFVLYCIMRCCVMSCYRRFCSRVYGDGGLSGIVLRPMSHLQFFRAILSREFFRAT